MLLGPQVKSRSNHTKSFIEGIYFNPMQPSHYLYQGVFDTRHSIKIELQNYTPTKDSTG